MVLFAFVFAATLYGTVRYIQIVFDGQSTEEAIVEGLSYSIQTVMAVGYGNWEPSRSHAWRARLTEDQRENRMYQLKGLSIGIMVTGGAFFGALIGAVSELVRTA